MSRLTVWPDEQPGNVLFQSKRPEEIARALAEVGVGFEQWATGRILSPGVDQARVLEAYSAEIEALKRANGYTTADVVRLPRGALNTEAARAKFLDEHTHSDDEVRFFVEGTGAFYLRCDGKVYQVVCAAGDLINVPANTRHWFDMGDAPHFTAIRLFTDPAGWVGHFTGDAIARRFPLFAA